MNEAPIRDQPATPLRRELGLPGAVLLGLGSIVGTGVFVSVGVAAGVAGQAVVVAIALAAALAACNGLSSARLAATFPVSGGTYEYAHRTLEPRLGFVAGWTFLCAKSASAATAALGLAGYLLAAAGVEPGRPAHTGLALLLALGVTALVAGGVKRTNRANAALVTVTLVALAAFVAVGLSRAKGALAPAWPPGGGWRPVLEASALMFVAFTGYGRIATLGEEVKEPARTIPRAVVVTLVVSAALYLAVALAGVAWVGAGALARGATGGAPLAAAARDDGVTWLAALLAVGAVTAMGGVLLNLVLGLSRVALAMARRGDLPRRLEQVDAQGSPRAAVIAVGVLIALLALVGDVKATWSFSAFTVLVYYAITNLAALRLPAADLRLPRVVPALGLLGCLGLAFFVEQRAWGAGLVLVGVGLVLRGALRRE